MIATTTHDYIGAGPYDWLIVAVLAGLLVGLCAYARFTRGPR